MASYNPTTGKKSLEISTTDFNNVADRHPGPNQPTVQQDATEGLVQANNQAEIQDPPLFFVRDDDDNDDGDDKYVTPSESSTHQQDVDGLRMPMSGDNPHRQPFRDGQDAQNARCTRQPAAQPLGRRQREDELEDDEHRPHQRQRQHASPPPSSSASAPALVPVPPAPSPPALAPVPPTTSSAASIASNSLTPLEALRKYMLDRHWVEKPCPPCGKRTCRRPDVSSCASKCKRCSTPSINRKCIKKWILDSSRLRHMLDLMENDGLSPEEAEILAYGDSGMLGGPWDEHKHYPGLTAPAGGSLDSAPGAPTRSRSQVPSVENLRTRSTTRQPTIEQPTIEQPTIEQPTIEQPKTHQPHESLELPEVDSAEKFNAVRRAYLATVRACRTHPPMSLAQLHATMENLMQALHDIIYPPEMSPVYRNWRDDPVDPFSRG